MEKEKLSLLWPYLYHDKNTWKYIDVRISDSPFKKDRIKWIKNPNFKYSHLDINNLKD